MQPLGLVRVRNHARNPWFDPLGPRAMPENNGHGRQPEMYRLASSAVRVELGPRVELVKTPLNKICQHISFFLIVCGNQYSSSWENEKLVACRGVRVA